MRQKSITLNLIINGIKTLMSVLFPLITFPYAARILGTVGIGKVDYASAIISYFALMASLGISTYAIREGARIRDDKDKFQKFIKEILHINVFTTLISYAIFIVFLHLPILQGYKKLLIIFSVGIMFTTIGIEWFFIIREEYGYITKRAILFQCISLALLFILVRNRDDYYWYAALWIISKGGSAILNLWHSRKFIDWRKKYSYEYRKHLKPIFFIFGTSLASSIYMTLDTTMLGIMKGDSVVGVYAAAVKINLAVSILMSTISSTILPRVSYYIGNGLKKEYEKLMKSSVDVLLMIAIPAVIGMICTSDILILFFSGKEFLSGVTAANILSVRVVIEAVNRVIAYQICTPYQKDKEVLMATTAGAVFDLVANIVLIPIAGVTGAATSTLLAEVVVFFILTRYAGNIIKMKNLYTRMPIYFISSIWFFAVRWFVNMLVKNQISQLLITVAICISGYFIILMLIKDPYLQDYKGRIINRIKKIGNK
ncbi:MAG: oligosaccharide flippase family protein [Muricomes sp.]